jgi:hypothetical protein
LFWNSISVSAGKILILFIKYDVTELQDDIILQRKFAIQNFCIKCLTTVFTACIVDVAIIQISVP